MAPEVRTGEPRMDATNLYREDVVTDRRVGTLRVLTPVKTDGTTDPGRPVLYVGEAQLLTQAGLLPLVFEIDATSLADAIEKFAAGATAAIERTRRELEELRREAASQIVVPPTLPPGFDPKGGPGGLPGGGKIHLR
ncbi:MAG TPA: hypothetical protein VGT02_18555 [Methylomirabilota bacterium]|nr:hypothetical protein [Methylomirabilota bacterium]